MFSFKIKEAKGLFFDRAKVKDALTKAERKNLSQAGAFIRQRAKTSIRIRKPPSQPGSPPSGHETGIRIKKLSKRKGGQFAGQKAAQPISLLREYIFFAFESSKRSVVIGPAKLNKKGSIPEVLEYGGTSRIYQYGQGMKTITIQPRPYMGPAYEAEKSKFPGLWADCVK